MKMKFNKTESNPITVVPIAKTKTASMISPLSDVNKLQFMFRITMFCCTVKYYLNIREHWSIFGYVGIGLAIRCVIGADGIIRFGIIIFNYNVGKVSP
jgi:hypothetical protein